MSIIKPNLCNSDKGGHTPIAQTDIGKGSIPYIHGRGVRGDILRIVWGTRLSKHIEDKSFTPSTHIPPVQEDQSPIVLLTSSFCDSDNDATVHNITVQTGYRPHMNPQLSSIRLPPVRKTVRRDNKVLQSVSLPKLSNYNMRSFLPKIENFGIDMHDRNCSLSFLTEVWEKSENKKHQLNPDQYGL